LKKSKNRQSIVVAAPAGPAQANASSPASAVLRNRPVPATTRAPASILARKSFFMSFSASVKAALDAPCVETRHGSELAQFLPDAARLQAIVRVANKLPKRQ
jgi:hypothetical protein